MARPPTGQVLERHGKRGTTYALRFSAYGRRQYETIGREGGKCSRCAGIVDRAHADAELENVLAEVRLKIWRPPTPVEPEEPKEEQTFHTFSSEWLEARKPELGDRTYEDYKWSLTHHLLPFFAGHRLSEITVREVDRYKTAKLAEGKLAPNTVNKTLTRLSQILSLAAEYELIPANPAGGKRRRVKGTRPRRPWAEPEQLLALLEAADGFTPAQKPLLAGRGRPLLAVLAGAGLRIDEALSLERENVILAKGTLTVTEAKTEAGVRVVDLTPALRDELANYLAGTSHRLVFPTSRGKKDNRQNVRQRLLMKAIERANVRLAELGIDPLGDVRPHGLRRTYASLRTACGDDPVYVSRQIGHEDVRFTLNVYAQSVKRRERMTEAERKEYDRAIEWASWADPLGTSAQSAPVVPESEEVSEYEKAPR